MTLLWDVPLASLLCCEYQSSFGEICHNIIITVVLYFRILYWKLPAACEHKIKKHDVIYIWCTTRLGVLPVLPVPGFGFFFFFFHLCNLFFIGFVCFSSSSVIPTNSLFTSTAPRMPHDLFSEQSSRFNKGYCTAYAPTNIQGVNRALTFYNF